MSRSYSWLLALFVGFAARSNRFGWRCHGVRSGSDSGGNLKLVGSRRGYLEMQETRCEVREGGQNFSRRHFPIVASGHRDVALLREGRHEGGVPSTS